MGKEKHRAQGMGQIEAGRLGSGEAEGIETEKIRR
jgi:hypothetical protein